MSTVHVLSNPFAARTARLEAEIVTRRLQSEGHDVVDLTGPNQEASGAAVREAVTAGAERLLVVGGDGLVHLALQHVAGSSTVLGLVPQGTGNDLARALDLLGRGSIDATVDAALADPVPIDALRTTHGWVGTVATLGFAGDVTERANGMDWPRGEAVYSMATVLQLPRLRQLSLNVTVDGGAVQPVETTMLSIGNTAFFGGGMRICPGADPVDGSFEATVVGGVGRLTFLRVFPKVFKGRHVTHPAVTVLDGTTMRLEVDGAERVDLWGDGELLGPLPVDVEVVADAVLVAGARP